jgi:ribosomal protein S6--L-glutamate ligase
VKQKNIALENRLRHCKNITTLGLCTNLSDYEDWQLDLIKGADIIYYPTAFYADIFDVAGKRTFPSYHTYKFAQDKIKQTALFNLLEIPHPRTRVFYGNRQKSTILNHFSFPFIGKIPRGSSLGRGVYLINNTAELAEYAQLCSPAYIQEYLPVDRDLRVIVIGSRPVHAYWRIAKENEFRTNVSQGANISFSNIPQEGIEFAVRVARMCRVDDVGLDLYCHQGQFGVFELNLKYGREGFKQAGINYYEMMDALIKDGKI